MTGPHTKATQRALWALSLGSRWCHPSACLPEGQEGPAPVRLLSRLPRVCEAPKKVAQLPGSPAHPWVLPSAYDPRPLSLWQGSWDGEGVEMNELISRLLLFTQPAAPAVGLVCKYKVIIIRACVYKAL